MKKKIIVSFGEILWDLLPDTTVLGGAPFNFTYRVNTLGDTGLMVSRLGLDTLGEKAYKQVVSLGLNTEYLQWDSNFPTGTVQVSFDALHNPDYVIIPEVAYDYIAINEALLNIAARADCLCFGSLAQRNKISRQTLAEIMEASKDSLKFLDINLRKDCYFPETIQFSLDKADVLKLNEEETFQLAEQLHFSFETLPQFCSEILEKYSLQYCLVTLAEKGAYVQSTAGEKIYVPGYRVPLADSLGSGDSFSAGFIHKILDGKSLQEACEFGNVLGAMVATKTGATPLITTDEVKRFVESAPVTIFHPQFYS
jgi:fructokinase